VVFVLLLYLHVGFVVVGLLYDMYTSCVVDCLFLFVDDALLSPN
jgi:hypothetical protein